MIFVDTNVLMYAVGHSHPLREAAREFFEESTRDNLQLCTSAEVLQELLHVYRPVGRFVELDAAFSLIAEASIEVWQLEEEDVTLARQLLGQFPSLGARDLCHLASCRRRGVSNVKTFDQVLDAAVNGG